MMSQNDNCRQDRSESCPPVTPGGRSPDKAGSDRLYKYIDCRQNRSKCCPPDIPCGRLLGKAGSDRLNKNINCRQDRSEGCPAALSAGVTYSYPCALSVMSSTDVALSLSWACVFRVTTLLSLVEDVACH